MIQGLRVLAVITARGGSKGLPRKNVLPLGGRPMISWTVHAALASAYIDRVILSSEDAEIQDVARMAGCEVPFDRPLDLAQDTTPSISVLEHALAHLPGYDLVVLLQPTSPFRQALDIDGCIMRCADGASSVVSVVQLDKSPYWMFTRSSEGFLIPILPGVAPSRRQDAAPVFALNGAVYVARVPWLLERRTFLAEETVAWEMPRDRSIDIDSPLDLQIAEAMLRQEGAPVA